MQKTKQWGTLIHETVQLGGKLVFLIEDAPSDLDEWLKPLDEKFRFEIPIVKRHLNDLLHKKFITGPEDLIFIFESQKAHLVFLNAVLQGQRVLISDSKSDIKLENADFLWSHCDLPKWSQMVAELHLNWQKLTKLIDIQSANENPCLFLDRDDVVIKNIPYNNNPEKVELIPGVENLISKAHDKGYWVALVTNQSGLGRGLITWDEYQKVHQRMLELLAQKGCWIDESVWAAYIEDKAVPYGRLYASLRKPRPGMFQMVNYKLQVHMQKSLMVGDSASDLIAAFNAGVGKLYLYRSEKMDQEKRELFRYSKNNPEFHFEVLSDFSEVIV
ncbi:MAG: D-glycero-alpha-D-manno-heptose-1,7-bisphosphate 7-phosphatase [Bdellovibrio sp.]